MGLVRMPRRAPRVSDMSRRSVAVWVLLTLVLGLLATAAGALAARRAERAAVEQQLSRRAELAGAEVTGELQRYADVAAAVAAGLSAQQEVTRQDFMAATAPLLKAGLAGAAGISFVSPVAPDQVAAEQERYRALGADDLTLRPALVRDHRFIVYGRTLDGIPIPVGDDAARLPQLVAVLDESRRFGRVAVSDPYLLLADRAVPVAQRQLSFVVVAPVESPVTGVLRGWLVIALHASDMIDATLRAPVGDSAGAVLRVDRRDGLSMPVTVRRAGPAAAGVPRKDVGLTVVGRRWTLEITATESAAAEDAQGGRFGLAVALGGLLATLLLAGMVGVLLGARRRALRDVDVAEADSRRQAELLGAVLDSISDGVGVIDEHGALLLHNPAAAQLFGPSLRPERPDWWKAYRFLHTDGRTRVSGAELPFARALRGEPVDQDRLVVRRPEDGDGGGVTIQASARPLDPRAGTRGAVAVFQDITARHRVEEELRAAEERERFAFDHAMTGMSVTDLAEGGDGRFLRVNRALCELTGYSEQELLGMTFQDITHPDDLWRGVAATREMRSGERDSTLVEKRYVRKDGRVVHVEIQSTLVRDSEGRVLYGVAQTQDVTAQRAETHRLNEAARTDPLTGLGNRQFLQDRLGHAVARTARSQRPLGVVFCDLDGFKPVNDTHGHLAGDEVLRVVAARLADTVRPADTVARLGGDEFVVICEDLDGPDDAHQVAARIRRVAADPVRLPDGTEVRVGCSTGVVIAAGPGLEVDELLHRADQAMYDSKRAARSG